MLNQYNTTLPTLANGDTNASTQVDARGRVRVVVESEGGSGGASGTIRSIADVTVAQTTAAAITTTDPTATIGITVQALSTNTVSVRVGNSSTSLTRGIELAPGASRFYPDVTDPALIYAVASIAGQKLAVEWQ